jgi:hypothetical protein
LFAVPQLLPPGAPFFANRRLALILVVTLAVSALARYWVREWQKVPWDHPQCLSGERVLTCQDPPPLPPLPPGFVLVR